MTKHVYPPSIRSALSAGMAPETKEDDGLAKLVEAIGENNKAMDERLKGIEKLIGDTSTSSKKRSDELEAKMNRSLLGGGANGGGSGDQPEDPEYSEAFGEFFRKGSMEEAVQKANTLGLRGQIKTALSVGNSESAGYIAPTEWDRQINKRLIPISPMRRLARLIPTTVGAYSTLWNMEGWSSGWVAEDAARPATDNATLKPITFASGEVYAMPVATQRLLDDSQIDLAGWLANEVGDTFGQQEGTAFIAGDGVNKPRGLMTYVVGGASAAAHPGGTVGYKFTGFAGAFSATTPGDILIDLIYSLSAPYRANANWLMNSLTASVIAKFKDGQGNYLWQQSVVKGQPATLLGYPVEIDENMPDIGANSYPIAFGDMNRAYVVNDRAGVRILRDPYTNKPFVNFYATKRVGGGILDIKAVKFLKMATS